MYNYCTHISSVIFKFNSLHLATSLRAIAVTSFICSTILCSPKLFFTLKCALLRHDVTNVARVCCQKWQECVVNSEVLNHFVQSNTIFYTQCALLWHDVAREECVVKCEVQSPAWSGFCCPVESSLSSFRCWWAALLFFSSDYHVSPRLLFFHPYHVHSILLLHSSPLPSSSFVSVCPD